jgi:pimeloyl-ACP methyl ester carboxylesterase
VQREIEVEGLRITYRRSGEGEPLVLLHGGASDSREWRRQLDALSDEFDVIAWDAPGCGGSSDPPESFRLTDYADCLWAFLEALGASPAHVAGLSFGAGLALELYRRHPETTRTMVLASAYAGWAGSLPREVVEERLRQVLLEADAPREDLVCAWLPTLFGPVASAELCTELAAIISDVRPAGMRAMARSFAEADLRDVLPRLAVPTLLLYGDADVRAGPAVGRELHAAIPRSTLVVLPGAGHQLNMEAAERFNAEVRAFLRSARAELSPS